MGALSWWHWVIVLLAFVILFGASRMPAAARGLGQSLRIFKSEVQEMQKDSSSKDSSTAADANSDAQRELPKSTPADPTTATTAADETKKSA